MGQLSDPAFWEALYRGKSDRWDLGDAAPPLARAAAELTPGRDALVLGCGRGYEARLLASQGWPRVVAVDFAPSAIRDAQLLGDWGGRVEWVQRDLFTLGEEYAGRFDLVLEHTCFCAIDPARRAEWAGVVHAVLRPGGVFLGLFWAHGRPGGPPFGTSQPEVEALLAGGRFALEREEAPADSVPQRRGEELIVVARKV